MSCSQHTRIRSARAVATNNADRARDIELNKIGANRGYSTNMTGSLVVENQVGAVKCSVETNQQQKAPESKWG